MKCHSLIYGVCVVACIGAAGLWYLTGSEGYTRWPNARLEQADAPAPSGQDDLLAEAGFEEKSATTTTPTIESRFAFGLLPGGLDPKHVPSVAAVVGASVFLSGITMIRTSRKRASARREGLHIGDRT